MEVCISQGARSLSDYARAAAFSNFGYGAARQGDAKQAVALQSLTSRVEELDRMVRNLTSTLYSVEEVKEAAGGVASGLPVASLESTRRKDG